MEEVREGLAYFALGSAGLHVLGVVFTSVARGEKLVRAMITGRRRA
jgi:cytochrome b